MRFTKDRCLSCGTPNKSTPHYVDDFWFCSSECHDQEFYKLIPKEFGPEKTFWDDDEIKEIWEPVEQATRGETQEYLDYIAKTPFYSLRDAWTANRESAYEDAQTKLHSRIEAEAEMQRDEQDEKERIVREKEEEKDRITREKEEAKAEKEWLEQQARDAEEEKWLPKPFEL